jgi:hypothetical protein
MIRIADIFSAHLHCFCRVDDRVLVVFFFCYVLLFHFCILNSFFVRLFHGNFVLDNAVPKKLLDMCPNRTDREFTHMRYSAATCDPNDFKDSGFTLRQVHYDPPRRTELFIVMTMYNEDEELFCRTMHGVIKNIAHLCKRDRSKTWGKDGWKKVVVCIVSDGRSKINSRTLSVIAAMGAYQEGVAKTKIGKQDVTAHIYEYTTQSRSSCTSQNLRALICHSRSLREPVPQDRGRGEGRRARAGHLLPEGEEPEEDQLAPLVLQRLWRDPAAERLCAARRGYDARPDVDLPSVEGVRHQLERGRRVRGDRRAEGEVWSESD